MAAERAAGARALCHRCGWPIAAGAALRLAVEHGTSASPDILWHRRAADCGPIPRVRRTP